MADKLVDWTNAENVRKLVHLWNVEKLPVRDIARAFGIGPEGRNAIVGKAHRLGLERRESPILNGNNGGWANGTRQRSDKPRKPKPLRESVKTLPPLESVSDLSAVVEPARLTTVLPAFTSDGIQTRFDKPAQVEPKSQPAAVVKAEPPRPAYIRRPASCLWPIGTPGKDMEFCGADAVPGRPYCATHVERAYIRVRARSGVTEGQAAAQP